MDNYSPPDIPDNEIRVRPHVVIDKFIEEFQDFIDMWTIRYPHWLQRYDIIHVLNELQVKLERAENDDRRRQAMVLRGGPREPEHGQYVWMESRRQWIFIDKYEAKRLSILFCCEE